MALALVMLYLVLLFPVVPPRTARMQGWFWSYLVGMHAGLGVLIYNLKTIGWLP